MATKAAAIDDQTLADHSEKDKTWDKRKSQNEKVGAIYEKDKFFQKYALRMDACSKTLIFQMAQHKTTGEVGLKLHRAQFCRVRNCPICQERKAMTWTARFLKALPILEEMHPKARFLSLVITVKNCDISSLRETIKEMNKAWGRFIKYDVFKKCMIGWARTTEITHQSTDSSIGDSHPHYHILLMVNPSKLTDYYVKHSEWVAAWRKAARLDYDPIVHVSVVKDKSKKNGKEEISETETFGNTKLPRKAISETFKYSVKPSDMIQNDTWFLELTRQIQQLHFVAVGGAIKEAIKEAEAKSDGGGEEPTEEDMLLKDGSTTRVDDLDRYYKWRVGADGKKRRYFYWRSEISVDS